MPDIRKLGNPSNLLRFKLTKSSDGPAFTGLTFASSGLIISTICDNEATAVAYTAAGSTIETITTLGTFATPTSNKCRFKEVDATNHPGLYEFQFADARFAVASARRMVVSVSGASGLFSSDYEIEFDPPVNVNQINSVAATSVTTINANIGTTQPVNYAGTGASAYVKAVDSSGNPIAPASATTQLSVDVAAVDAAIAALNDLSSNQAFSAVLTTQLTESYAADGVAPTLAQAIFLIQQSLHEFAISGTTRTVKKLDGSTTAATFALDDASAPTSTTRAT